MMESLLVMEDLSGKEIDACNCSGRVIHGPRCGCIALEDTSSQAELAPDCLLRVWSKHWR